MDAGRAALGSKLVTAEEAVARVRSGDLVRFPLGRVPRTLAAALAGRRDELRDVRVLQGATAYPLAWATDTPGWDEHIAYVTDYITPLVRPCLDARRGDFAVTDYAIGSRAEAAGRHGGWAADVFMAEVSQPDAEGGVGFGYGPWHAKALLAAAKLSIAEEGQGVFRASGDASGPLADFDLAGGPREDPFHPPDDAPEPGPAR